MRNIFFLYVMISTAACSQKGAESDSDIFLAGKPLAELIDKRLQEPSGLAASANNPGLLWTHNDSGNDAEVFLIDEKLEIKLICKLQGVTNRDWEDIAVGPGPEAGRSYVYVGEIGDNFAMFPYKHIFRFEEPVARKGEKERVISRFDTITFQLSDAQKDTESLMINPLTRDLFVISKREEPVYVYKLKYPYSTKDTLTATKLIALPLTQIVAADFSADGKEVLMKNYKNVFYWKMNDKTVEEVLQEKPRIIGYKAEPQGEAITFSRDGSGFFTLSEKIKDEKSFLFFYERK